MQYVDAPPPPAIVMVQQDNGGRWTDYELATERYKVEKRQVRIAGRCASGCTMSLALKTTCVYPQASFGFHTARYRITDDVSGTDVNAALAHYTTRLWNMYPA